MRVLLTSVVLALLAVQAVASPPAACWRDALPRKTAKKTDDGKCPSGYSKSFGICYQDCGDHYDAYGPLCWDECTAAVPVNGLVFCCDSQDTCTELLKDLALKTPEALVKTIVDIATATPVSIAKILKDLRALVEDARELA
eukprot:CAMPEP_0181294774 /NCGR_PEP_ID=MMETSP1101-20121128/3788_1 /TAXON_ID=46948 /ORGANISM="Rhodomonas abbreviata, Strain Caron Lab Isolate" /LENGTH=140 /DNA_ID=CAMNT_0023399471 /DNA_START=75 /DNA_END=494 /DNA_ORIENTATION=+